MLRASVPGDNTPLHHGLFAGFPRVGHNFNRPLNIVRMHIGTFAVELLLKFLFGITDQIQETAAVPENRPHILGVHPRKSAGNGPDNGIYLLVLFGQLILRALAVVGQLDARPTPCPADRPVLDHEGFLQKRIVEFPVIIRILPQLIVGAEGAGSGSALNNLITFASQHLVGGFSQCFVRMLVQIQQLVGIHIADIDITHVGVKHPVKILLPLTVELVQLLLLRHKRVHIRKLPLEHTAACIPVLKNRTGKLGPEKTALLQRQPHRQIDLRLRLVPHL